MVMKNVVDSAHLMERDTHNNFALRGRLVSICSIYVCISS